MFIEKLKRCLFGYTKEERKLFYLGVPFTSGAVDKLVWPDCLKFPCRWMSSLKKGETFREFRPSDPVVMAGSDAYVMYLDNVATWVVDKAT